VKKLSKDQIELTLTRDGRRVVASLYEEMGYRHWQIISLSDLPNDLISLDDLKRFGIDVVHGTAVESS
jgi:hypothetical protein